DGEAVRLRVCRRCNLVDGRRPRPLHVPRDHAPVHDVVPGADHPARARQPERCAARVPRAAVGRVSRGLVASRLGCATRGPAAPARQPGLLGRLFHGYVDAVSGLHDIAARIEAGSRIDTAEAATLWRHASDEELQRLAGLVRARYHEPDRATYMVMRIINYTNVCVAQCDYC